VSLIICHSNEYLINVGSRLLI